MVHSENLGEIIWLQLIGTVILLAFNSDLPREHFQPSNTPQAFYRDLTGRGPCTTWELLVCASDVKGKE